jgi:hypothetical protein
MKKENMLLTVVLYRFIKILLIYLLLITFVISMLREAATRHMIELYMNNKIQGTSYTWKIKSLVDTMNQSQIYVDQIALQAWLANGGDIYVYREAFYETKKMFMRLYDKLYEWTKEIQRHDTRY